MTTTSRGIITIFCEEASERLSLARGTMDCNSKATPTQWRWGSVASLYAKSGHNPKQAQPTDWEIDHGSPPLYSYSGGGGGGGSTGSGSCSASDMGNGCSSKSPFPASMDSAVPRAGPRAMVINFEAVPRDPTITRKEPGRVEELTETSRELLPASGGSAEPLIGLKLGKRTYFEHACTEKNGKHISVPAIPTLTASKSTVSHQNLQISRCQVEGCHADLTSAKGYHRKHKVCQAHSKCPKVIVAGRESRFCQQCSRFHDLSEFDQKKRSCRRRLSDHNARRRKPPAETIPFNPSSSFYDDRQQMNLLLNQSPFGHMKLTNSTWESSCNFKLPYIKGSWMRSTKARGTGLEASDSASNFDGAPDVWHAPSLLSNGSLGLADPGPTSSINQLMHVNHPSAAQTAVHVAHTRADYWQAEQPLDQVLPFPSHSDGGQFHGFDLLKAPHGYTFLDVNHLD